MKRLLLPLCCILLGIATLSAQTSADIIPKLGNNLVVCLMKSSLTSDGKYNCVNYAVDVASSGDYYPSFWISASQNADGSFDALPVYVNDSKIGSLAPKSTGWQETTIANQKPIALREGINIISIASDSKEFPLVDCVKLAPTRSLSKINTENYDVFINKIRSKEVIDTYKATGNNDDTTDVPISFAYEYTNVPVEYTYQCTQNLKKGDQLIITTESGREHAVDMFIIGTMSSGPIVGPILSFTDVQSSTNAITLPKMEYTAVTEKAQRGLNWHAPSFKKNVSGELWESKMIADITMDGVYMVRLRGVDLNHPTAGEARLRINDKDYGYVPYTYNARDIRPKASGRKYKYFTTACGSADPMIFIQSYRGSRIIAYNDDGGSGLNASLTANFSLIPQFLHISSYNSLTASSTCTIRVQDMGSANAPVKSAAKTTNETSGIDDTNICGIKIRKAILTVGESLEIVSDNEIDTITIYDIKGNIIFVDSNCGGNYTSSIIDLNISSCGIYIVNVKTGNDCESFKIIINN